MGPQPVLFLDSVEVNIDSFRLLDPFNISNITKLESKSAIKVLGEKGADGAFYVTTVKAAKAYYWRYFSTKSEKYRQLVDSPQADTSVLYVLNGKPLTDKAAPGALFLINNKNFKRLKVLDKEDASKYLTAPKLWVVSIKAKRPKGLVNTSKLTK